MTISKAWRQAYTELTDSIAKHSEVEIGVCFVSIPENIRSEFYRLFNAVRTAFVEEKFSGFLDEAISLNENYLKAEEEVVRLLGLLESISTSTALYRFLHNPNDELIRGLLDPLFDLLKGKIDIETFEERASRNIDASFRILYRSGYEKWVVLSLVKLLEADESLQVTLRRLTGEGQVIHGSHIFDEPVPPPEESKRLSFEHELLIIFKVPDFIVHSAKIKKYVSVRSGMGEALCAAFNPSEKREWYPLNSVGALEPGLILFYVADNSEEISLVADAKKICKPDLVIECREQKDWFEKEGLDKVMLHHDSLKPRLGTYIVSREPVPEQVYNKLMPSQFPKEPASEQEQEYTQEQEPRKQGEAIHILTVGFDQSKLEPIISTLMNQEDKEQ